MSFENELVPGGNIEYKGHRTKKLIAVLLLEFVMLAGLVWVFLSQDSGNVIEDIWLWWISVAVIVFTIIMTIRSIRFGVRDVIIQGDQLTIIYPS